MHDIDLSSILSLPVNVDETWRGGIVNMAQLLGMPSAGIDDEDAMLILWLSSSTGMAHAKPCRVSAGDSESLFDEFLKSLLEFQNLHEFPFRPKQIQSNDEDVTKELAKVTSSIELDVVYKSQMPSWERVLSELTDQLTDQLTEEFDDESSLPSLIEAGCSEEQVREFARASANFYDARLWDYLDDVDLIAFESPKPPKDIRFGTILGSSGQTFGIGFYSDEETHHEMMAQRADPGTLSLMSVTYEPVEEIESDDVQLWKKLDLPLGMGKEFPDFYGFSASGARRPTAKELEYATIVLQALAETTEEEIDTGAWTKTIDYRGNQKRCKFSIPNLTNPPDRAEWIRRGMTPETRGNERHFEMIQNFLKEQDGFNDLDELNDVLNAKFTGSMDDVEYPMDTPSDRAAAKCQEAIESFGRRRVQLARQALAEDPNHVESLVLVAESTGKLDKRIEAFQRAADAGRRELGSAFEEDAGHFWGITKTRPFMRACHGLAIALHAAGQTEDAIAQYREMLRLNPGDNQGVRYQVIPLLISLQRESDAMELLKQHKDESATWYYMNSLVEYLAHGPTSTNTVKAMRAAFKANEHVVTQLESNDPPYSPSAYSVGSLEEAITIIDECMDTWGEADGYLDFMMMQYLKWEKDRQKKQRDARHKARRKKLNSKQR